MTTGFVFEGRGKGERTGHEKIAMRNIKYSIDWIVGGYYNCLLDGYEEDLPDSKEALAEEIYSEALVNAYSEGCEHFGRAPKEMRFAGEKFCKAYIEWKLDRDDDVKEIFNR